MSSTPGQDGGWNDPEIDLDSVAQGRRRSCSAEGCHSTVSAYCLDPHTRCFRCRGDEPCTAGKRCSECAAWSPKFMASCEKHFLKMRGKHQSKL